MNIVIILHNFLAAITFKTDLEKRPLKLLHTLATTATSQAHTHGTKSVKPDLCATNYYTPKKLIIDLTLHHFHDGLGQDSKAKEALLFVQLVCIVLQSIMDQQQPGANTADIIKNTE